MKYEFKDGCIWEGGGFVIESQHEFDKDDFNSCKNCNFSNYNQYKRIDGKIITQELWICPFVVVAENEGGFNSTGVCLECIIEAAQIIKTIHKP